MRLKGNDPMKRTTKEEVMKAALIWKAEHPYEDYVKKEVEVKLPNGVVVPLGTRLRTLKSNPKYLTKEEKEFFDTLEIRKKLYQTKNEMKQAAEIWKKDHPNETYVDKESKVTLLNGKIIEFGKGLRNIKSHINRLSEKDKIFWSFYDISESPQLSEEKWREAVIIWRKEHPDERSIKKSTKVIISSGKEINLGKKVDNLKYNADKLSEEERSFWEKYNVFENVRPTEEEYQEAAIIWRKEHPNDSSIKTSTKVIISSGKEINLGKRVNNLKYNAAKLSEEERYFWSEYGIFETKEERTEKKRIQYWSVDNSISPKKLTKNNKLEIVKELKVRKAFEEWKEKNPMLAATACDTKVTLPTGKVVNVRSRIINLQTLFKTGKFEMTETEIKRYWTFQRVLHRQCDNSSYQFHQQRSLADLGKEYLYRLYGKEEKVYYIIKCLKEIREKDRTLNNFVKNLKLDDESFSRGMKRLKKESEGQDKKYDFNQSISQFCATYGYKEDSLRKVISLQKVCPYDTLEQLVNRALISDKLTSPSNWIYEKYGRNIEAILEYLHLDASLILREMSQDVMTLEETIASTIFKNNNTSIKYQWVEVPFQYFKTRIDPKLSPCEISKKCSDFSKTYHMNREENILLQNCFVQYISLMQEYRKMEIGLETNEVRRYKQIQIYNFSSDDIEESFFLPLELNREKLIGKGLELYQRRSLLRQYAIDWNLYEEDEKIQLIKKEKMTKEEVSHIETIRTKIDETIENSIKTKRKII